MIWFLLLAVLLVGYFVLDGATTGVSIVLPGVAGGERDRRGLVTAVGPYFLANEVWLVAVGGILIGAFPEVEGRVLAGHHPVVVVLLIAWVVRDATVWLRRTAGPVGRARWDTARAAAALVLAAAWGLLLGTLATGIAPHGAGLLAGFTPAALVWTITVPALFAAHGATFLAVRGPRATVATTMAAAARLGPVAAALTVVAIAATAVVVPAGAVVGWLTLGGVGAVASIGAVAALRGSRPTVALIATSVAAAAPVFAVGAAVVADVLAAVADAATLGAIGWIVVLTLVVIAASLTWLVRAFHGRVDARSAVFF